MNLFFTTIILLIKNIFKGCIKLVLVNHVEIFIGLGVINVVVFTASSVAYHGSLAHKISGGTLAGAFLIGLLIFFGWLTYNAGKSFCEWFSNSWNEASGQARNGRS